MANSAFTPPTPLQGNDGPTGPQGETGAQGDAGATGAGVDTTALSYELAKVRTALLFMGVDVDAFPAEYEVTTTL